MTRFLIPLLGAFVLFAVGCDNSNRDTDEDFLTDLMEEAIGSDPESADSDGDGFDDAYEYLSYFDPNDPTDFPYTGDYPRLPLPADIDGEGWDEGEISRNWDDEDAIDGFEEIVSLHRFYGNVILIDVGAEWCGPCQAAAPEAQEKYEEYREQGFVVINLLLDGLDDADGDGYPDEPDLNRWQNERDDDVELTFPVIGDHDRSITEHYGPESGGSSIPNFTIIGRDLEIVARYQVGAPDWGTVEDLLEEDLPEVAWPLPENAEEIREELDIAPMEVPYLVPGEDMPEGAADVSSGDGEDSDDAEAGAEDSSDSAADVKAGRYAGPPFGGSSCTTAGSPASTGGLGLLFLLFGGLVLRRRN